MKLASLGGGRVCDRVDCDVDLDEPFARWKTTLFSRLDDIVAARPARNAPPSAAVTSPSTIPATSNTASVHTRSNPFLAPLLDKRPLTPALSSKLTLHLVLSIAPSATPYQARA